MRAGDERLRKILRIGDNRRDHEPHLFVGRFKTIEKLLYDRVRTVGDSVLPQVSRAQLRGNDFQIALSCRAFAGRRSETA